MKRNNIIYLSSAISVLALIIVLAIAVTNNKASVQTYATVSAEQWATLKKDNIKYNSKEEFIKESEEYFNEIGEYCWGKEWPQKFNEKYSSIDFMFIDGISHTNSKIYLNKTFMEHNLAPTAHEITHVIYTNSNASLREGFATYCQEKFGGNPSIGCFGVDIHVVSRMYMIDELDAVKNQVGIFCVASAYTDKYRSIFYNLSHSFVKYLIDTYGIEKFLLLYKTTGTNDDYKAVYNKDFGVMKTEWITYLNNYKSSLTNAEIKQKMKNTLIEHKIDEKTADAMLNSMGVVPT